jgi:hypothetical protein
MARRPFPPVVNFHALSLRDLLEAREAYHAHLSQVDNVVATAVGRYRIRRADLEKDEDWALRGRYSGKKDPWKKSPERTLDNSVVVPDSWPCLLVFVDRWQDVDALEGDPERVVPKRLYLPDGRMIPVCIIKAQRDDEAPPPLHELRPGGDVLGGGQPVFSRIQGGEQVGSVACLVTDGSRLFALTNRHVAGEPGRAIRALVRGEGIQVGTTSALQVGKILFEKAYTGWPGTRAVTHLDAALVEIEDRWAWTAQVYGIGEIGEPIDLNTNTISLDLVGTRVRGFGGVSGPIEGEIQALFYRCRSIGGVDYIADLLIGPRSPESPVKTRPGDSGTLWFYDPSDASMEKGPGGVRPKPTSDDAGRRARRLRPIALEWGGHRFLGSEGEERHQYALATCLSTVLRILDVEIVRGWNIGFSEYWGKVGHYKVGAKACGLATNGKLGKLMQANLDRVAFDDSAIEAGQLANIDAHGFVPLADVADLVWRRSRHADAANHFADMDQEGDGDFAGATLLELCQDPKNVDVRVWNSFYESLDENTRGALPFRVWQIYDEMVGFVRAGEIDKYTCAAGVLAHYVGDASQPLHVSHLHHGHDESEKRVHADYETKMLDRFAVEFNGLVNAVIATTPRPAAFSGGKNAAVTVIALMSRTIGRLSPEDVIDAWAAHPGQGRIAHLWGAVKNATAACVADGSMTLATIWQSAWLEGGGNQIASAALVAQDKDRLKELYDDKSFLPAMSLKKLEETDVLQD